MIRGLRPDVKIALAGRRLGRAGCSRAHADSALGPHAILADVDGGSGVGRVAASLDSPPRLWRPPSRSGSRNPCRPAPRRHLSWRDCGGSRRRGRRATSTAPESTRASAELARAQAYLTDDVSPQPAGPDPSEARFYDGRTLAHPLCAARSKSRNGSAYHRRLLTGSAGREPLDRGPAGSFRSAPEHARSTSISPAEPRRPFHSRAQAGRSADPRHRGRHAGADRR